MDQGDWTEIDVFSSEAFSLVPAPEMHLSAVEAFLEKWLQGRTEPADVSGVQGIPGIVYYRAAAARRLGVNLGETPGLFSVQFVYAGIHDQGLL